MGAAFDESDLNLTTVQFTAQAKVNEWVNVAVNLLYEDFTFATFLEEDVFTVDVASVVIGNQDLFPAYGTLGRIYVPLGALPDTLPG